MAGLTVGLQLHSMEIRSADKLEVAFKDVQSLPVAPLLR